MKISGQRIIAILILTVVFLLVIFFGHNSLTFIPFVFAHCDTLGGPVIKDARLALDKGDVTPVLKWVKKENESEIRMAFSKTLKVRSKGAEAKELADMYFFETLVRIHRAGEGAPYTGIKPVGTDLGPAVTAADKSLETGSVNELTQLLTGEVSEGIQKHFMRAIETKKHSEESVEAGREYVEAYVEFVHYAEKLYLDALGSKEETENRHKH